MGAAGDPDLTAGTVRPHQGSAVPGVRHANAQVHVVGELGAAIHRVRSRDRPVVAADRGALDAWIQERRHRCLQGCGLRELDDRLAAQVEHLGAGDRRGGDRLADDRRVPLRPDRPQEGGERLRQEIVDQPVARLALGGLALEVEEHGVDDEDGVLRASRRRARYAGRGVPPGLLPERGEAGVDPFGVGGGHRPLFRAGLLDHPGGGMAEAMDADPLVDFDREATEEGRTARRRTTGASGPSGRSGPGRGGSQSAGGVGAVRGADRRHPEGVALDGDRRGQAGDHLAIQPRQARLDLGADPEGAGAPGPAPGCRAAAAGSSQPGGGFAGPGGGRRS